MSLVNKQFYERHKKRRLEKLWRRSLAWLLAICICLGNVNVAAFAAETSGIGSMGATPSNAVKDGSTATPSNADGSASEIWLPDGTMTGEELLAEAERAVTNEFRFDFDNLMKMIDNGDSEAEDGEELSTSGQYEKLFKGYENFTLFYDNGKYGRLGGDSDEAYAYIVVRLSKEDYHSYVTGEPTHRVASASDAEPGGYKMQGDEDIIFLYVNASEQDVSFYLDLEGIEASGVTVPNADAIYDEPEPKEESLPAEGSVPESAVDGIQTGGAAGGGDVKVETSPESPALDGTEVSGENPESGESGSAGTDSGTTEGKDTAESQESSVPSSSEDSIEETAETRENASAEETTNLKETAEAVETTASTETTESAETAGLEEAAEAPETASEIQADEADKPAESEVKLSSARHHVFTLMEPAWEEEDQEFVEDDDEMTFEEWQEMMGGDDDEDEYDDSGDVIYDEEEGIIYLNMSVLPAAVAEVKKAVPKRRFFRSALFAAEEPLTKAALQASVTSADSLTPKVSGAHKQIEFKGGDSYRLHLDIAGGGAPLGIVLVIDTSGSMGSNYGYEETWGGLYPYSRLEKVKRVLTGYGSDEGFIAKVLAKNSESVFSIVTFDEYGEVKLNGAWTNSANTLKSTINSSSIKASGGTNCEDGLWYANEQLKKLDEKYVPCMIFLSDGAPTFYMGTENGFEGGYKKNGYNRVDRKGDGNKSEDTATVNAANIFRQQNENLKSYAINVGGSASNSVLKAITGDGKNVISADKSADLDTAFTSILDSMKLKNVKIEDTLSEYVDLPGDSLKNANVTVMAGDEELPDSKYSLSYDSSKKKVTLDLSKATASGVLDLDKVYSLAFDIKVNEHAKNEYKTQKGYPAGVVGGQDTDYKGNDTSVGKAGFYSNTEAKATWEGNTAGFTYPKPVVQVPYEPEHRKYIKDNKNGTYDLTLDVTSKISGTSTETVYSPVDVLFVLDRTGSMAFDVNGKQSDQVGYDKSLIRKDLVNKAVKTMISGSDAIGGLDEYTDFRYNSIKFWDSNATRAFGVDSWKNVYNSDVALSTVNGGTYPNTAVTAAIELIKNGSKENRNKKDVRKHIILLTDGEPSYPSSQKEGIDNAIAGLNNLSTPVTFHVISFASETSDYLDDLTEALNKKPNVTAIPYDANENITTIFNAIKTSIESSIGVDTTGVKNAVITDTLSEYAEFANANITSDDVELLWNGTPMTAEQRAKAIKSVEVNSNTKTVKVTFVAGYELEKGVTYSVRFKVKPTEEANRKYAADGDYSDIGDEGTDDPAVSENERTSSGKKGFYSNETATLTYTSNDSPGEVSYQKPVLQVPQAPYEPEHWKYIKDNKDGTYDLTLDVTSKISGTSSETVYSPVDVLFVLDRTGSMAFDVNGKKVGQDGYDKDLIRKDLVNKAVKTMISGSDAIGGLEKYTNFRYNSIKFWDSNASQVFKGETWKDVYDSDIALSTVSGGTYPNTAVTAAIELIKKGSEGNRNKNDVRKHVILLTDGEPSSPSSQKKGIENAIAGLNELSTPVTFHVISFASKTSDYLDDLTEALNEKSNVTAIPYDANENIVTIFNAIKTSIESSIGVDTTGVKNAVITDTLSEYAEFANANITSDDVELLWNGTPMTEEQRAKAIESVEVNSDTKTVKVTFVAGYELEKGVIYSIRFKVKPTEEAYRKYAADGDYSDIGDEGTDDPAVPENERTSSGEKGFYSNDTATLTYTSNDSPGEVPYQKPVLQVTRGRFTIIKTVTGGDEGKEFIVHVKAEDGTEYSSFPLKQYQEGDILSYIYAGEKTTFTITESVPMEYKDDADNPTFVVTNHGDFVKEAKRQLEITVGPGDDIMIEVQNVFDHKTYFHGDHLVINRTTGNPERPFTNATERTENYLLEQAATPVDPGKRGIEFRELGEDDALA